MRKSTAMVLAIVIVSAIFFIQSAYAFQNFFNRSAKSVAPKVSKPQPKIPTTSKSFDDVVFDWSGTFAEVLRITGEKHYKVSNPKEAMISSINSFLNNLDPHSSFLDPKTYKAILETTSGQFFGIGIVIDNTRSSKDKFLTVINTIPNGPAEKAGVRAYDKIVEIEGKKLEGMTTEEATAKLRGPRNTKIKIKALRENKKSPLAFEITRDVIKAQTSFAFYIKEYDVYYVSLTTFSNNAVKQIKAVLEKSAKKPYKGLIIDLRNNSGGLLNAVIDISGLFLDKGSLVVTTKDKHNNKKSEYKTTQDPVAHSNIPIFILVNNYTASASEILAGCLKIHSQNIAKQSKNNPQKKLMAFIVGAKTFGKGSVQEVIPISNNSAIKLTTSLYFLPDDTTIQGQGIEPDFVVEKLFPPPEKVTWFLQHYGREESLKHSIKPKSSGQDKNKLTAQSEKNKEKKETKQKTWNERIKEMLQKDNQFKETLKLVNLFDLSKNHFPEKIANREKAAQFLKDITALNGTISMEEVKI